MGEGNERRRDLPKGVAAISLLILHLLFKGQIQRLLPHIEHVVDFFLCAVIFETVKGGEVRLKSLGRGQRILTTKSRAGLRLAIAC